MPTSPRLDRPRTDREGHARSPRVVARGFGVSAVLLVLAVAPTAFAERSPAPVTESDARAAYDVGAAAYDKGDLAAAAAAFARADAIVPSDVALELAITCALRVGDAPLAMDLVARAEARGALGEKTSLAETAKKARDAFAKTASHLTLVCPETMHCEGAVDGTRVETGRRIWLAAGEHSVDLVSDGTAERLPVHLEPGSGVDVRPTRILRIAAPATTATNDAPAPMTATSDAPAQPHDWKLAQGWFWGAAALTTALGVGTVASAADTSSLHSAYSATPSDELAREGRAAQSRTNALLIATGATALGTAALGLFAIRWSSAHPEKGEVRATARGPVFSLEGSF